MSKLSKSRQDSSDDTGYRDRAKERRQAYNQPKQAAPQKHNNTPDARPAGEDPPEVTAPSKGASLLGKMGWAIGTGLGAQGTGMLTPVASEMYVQGVGLGAQGGKVGDAADEAMRSTKGDYQGFVDKTKERAKERFESLS
jgi:RNA-binding protein 5/10